ncbi:AAA family ATPase [Streptomyces telluris]|uniref:ATP-binding protein n=1 Tax=Streptomyces telluris TaxID=2720021 RepID=A0A9X2RKR7_9ACTN|nr:AAA family ATPase [Streptomyces telluris]MCQ8768779.1 ATP-binding protein [Streptomyces telluris]NJP81004.1 AAA family ATPase [Streptomyces telluris]
MGTAPTAGTAGPARAHGAAAADGGAARPRAGVLDLRSGAGRGELRFPAGDVLIVSGLPGSGKSTLIRRAVSVLDAQDGVVWCVDSQDTRERLERHAPGWLPYAIYRPFARLAHYAALRRALRSTASAVVHDCGQRGWVRRWVARDARRRGGAAHLLLLDVPPGTALAGQAARGRGVSPYAFRRHRRAMARLLASVSQPPVPDPLLTDRPGRLPAGVASVVLLDRGAVDALRRITFE